MFRFTRLVIVATVAVGLLVQAPADAANPAGGTINKRKKALAWSGGPFTFSSAFPADTGIDCLQGSSDQLCDHFALTVNLGDGANVEAAIRTPNACSAGCLAAPVEGEDYDLYVYAPDGTLVAEKASPGGNEKLVFKHRKRFSGKPYELRIVPWAVRPGSTYKGTVKALSLGR